MGNHSNVIYSERIKPMVRIIEKLSYRQDTWQVFQDFLSIAAVTISNSVDFSHREQREKDYMQIIEKYTRDELELFVQLFAELVMALERCVHEQGPTDLLGLMFHELELHNEWRGQFFTPQNVADMMAQISISPDDVTIARRNYVTVCEPACGSGVMILSFAKAMEKSKFNYCSQMVVDATDIDIRCVQMTYIQLSLYGIPAVVRHGNSMTMEEWSQWFTPVYMIGGWVWRNYLKDDIEANNVETADSVNESSEIEIERPKTGEKITKFDISLHENDQGQFLLF